MCPPDTDSVARPPRLSRRADWAGRGSIINALMARALAQPDLISLAAGFVDQQTLPAEPARRAFAALAAEEARMKSALQYGTTIGYPPLRETLVERLLAADGQTAASPERLRDRVVLTAGSNELLYLVSDVLFDPGDIVLCSSPSYFVYLGTLGNLGVRAVGVASDAQGIIPAAVEEELLRRAGGRTGTGEGRLRHDVLRQSLRRDPAGRPACRLGRDGPTLPPSHRKIYVIEDAAYRELRYLTATTSPACGRSTRAANGHPRRRRSPSRSRRACAWAGACCRGSWSSRCWPKKGISTSARPT